MKLLKAQLAKEFEIKGLGQFRYFLGIEVARSKKDIFLTQRKYVLDLLKEMGMLGRKLSIVPLDPNHRLKDYQDNRLIDARRYQRLVRHFIYLSLTRPDIAYAVP